jgi:hypothetical protein
MTKLDIVIVAVFIGLSLLVLATNKLARAVVRETFSHPFRRAKIRIKPENGQVEVEVDDKGVGREAMA